MQRPTVTVVNYGMGNVWSVQNSLEFVGAKTILTADPEAVARAECLILPGVGVFGTAMRRLQAAGLSDAIVEAACRRRVPFLGICVGMQLLVNESDESPGIKGFGWIAGRVHELDAAQARVPHMGFSATRPTRDHPILFRNMRPVSDFYFVHAYHVVPAADADVLSVTTDASPVVSAVHRENVVGVQFHPEKSQSNGLQFLANFLEFTTSF